MGRLGDEEMNNKKKSTAVSTIVKSILLVYGALIVFTLDERGFVCLICLLFLMRFVAPKVQHALGPDGWRKSK